MLPVIIYAGSCVGAVVFEAAFRLASRRFGQPHSRSQWALFAWTSAFVLCALTLMRPFETTVLADWCPMFIVSSFHIQQAYQAEIVARLTKPSGPTP